MKEINKLDELKGKNPFSIPTGYMEGLTGQIMSQLPEKPKAKEVTLMARVRPWLYMAAVFAGLGLFFEVIVGVFNKDDVKTTSDSMLVKTEVPVSSYIAINEDDQEYLEFIEAQYTDYIIEEEMSYSE